MTLDGQAMARATNLFLERNTLVEGLRAALDVLVRGTLFTVAGEVELVNDLRAALGRATALIPEYAGADPPPLEELLALLSGPEWEVAGELPSQLAALAQRQDEEAVKLTERAQRWRSRADDLNEKVIRGRAQGAPLREEGTIVDRLVRLVRGAEEYLEDRQYRAADQTLTEVEGQPNAVAVTTPPWVTDDLDSKILARTRVERDGARLAELLVFRDPKARVPNGERSWRRPDAVDPADSPSPPGGATPARTTRRRTPGVKVQADPQEHPGEASLAPGVPERQGPGRPEPPEVYSVILRTPSRPGVHGVSVQMDQPVRRADRESIRQRLRGADALAARLHDSRPWDATDASNGDQRSAVIPADANVLDKLRDVGDLLYRLFLPTDLQRLLARTSCPMVLATNDLELPWELLHDGNDFLATARPMARMPLGRAQPREAREFGEPRQIRVLLSHADPDGSLPHAKAEIEAICKALEHWDVKVEVDDAVTSEVLGDALRHNQYDIIHHAGHASFDPEDPDGCGLYLADREVFCGSKVRQFVEGQPLVFLNACESGAAANETIDRANLLTDPAGGLATGFIYGGALGCIGAVSPVDDSTAAEFAIAVYDKVIGGETVGESVRHARSATLTAHPDQPTWASYVLFGDPTFRLKVNPSSALSPGQIAATGVQVAET